MENNTNEKKGKNSKAQAQSTLRIGKETRKRIVADLARINKKDFGKKVRMDQYISLAIGLIQPEHFRQLQENSLSNADRFERDYRAYVGEHGPISKDEYLGMRLSAGLGVQKGE